MRFRIKLTFLMLVTGLALALSAWAQQKPLTRDQVQSLVRSGLGGETGAKAIEQSGIDFVPAEDFIQSLKAAGASKAFLKALRTAKPPELASGEKPINTVQVFTLLVGQVPSRQIVQMVQERGIDSAPTEDYLREVRLAGGEDELINAIRGARVTKPATIDPAVHARQAGVQQHAARGAELNRKGQYAEAEQEYRAALALDPQNADVYVALAIILTEQKKWDDAGSAARAALGLNPDNDMAHNSLGAALEQKGGSDEAIAEFREALRLNPSNDMAHVNLGFALRTKGFADGEIAEYREALRLNPRNDTARLDLGDALGLKGDWDNAIAEYREALRLNPDLASAHARLGMALGRKGDLDGQIAEYREALRLDPNDTVTHVNLGDALAKKGDWDGVISPGARGPAFEPETCQCPLWSRHGTRTQR